MKQLGRPTTDVLAVTMPCFGTTKRTRSNAEILCDELHVSFTEIDIAATVHSHFRDIGQSMDDHSVTFENGQARERTQILMDVANSCRGLVVGTGDMSEDALGWCTFGGDHLANYNVNVCLTKTMIRRMVTHLCSRFDEQIGSILHDIVDTPVSPELLPPDESGKIQQKTEDILGNYALHDFFLYYMIRFGFPPAKIYRIACETFADETTPAVIKHWLQTFVRRFFAQQFKRSCLPDGPKVGSVTLSPRGDWRMPSDAVATLWLQQLEEL